jgi:transglutaminase-like putative cysteine protease
MLRFFTAASNLRQWRTSGAMLLSPQQQPARDFFGIRVADLAVSKSLGKSGEITKAQHCRAEVFIEGKRWLPVDPADVRKVVLEEELAVDSGKVRTLREGLFGNWEMNWVGFNYAHDFTLPGPEGRTD